MCEIHWLKCPCTWIPLDPISLRQLVRADAEEARATRRCRLPILLLAFELLGLSDPGHVVTAAHTHTDTDTQRGHRRGGGGGGAMGARRGLVQVPATIVQLAEQAFLDCRLHHIVPHLRRQVVQCGATAAASLV